MSERKIKIMGILNVTPDSFYDGGNYLNHENAVKRGVELFTDGADILDIGGESTRPGAKSVTISEEIDRVCPVIEKLKLKIDIPISVDTTKSEVAEAALNAGAEIVNDISGLSFDNRMSSVIAENSAGIILMHIKGVPENMQDNPEYDDIIEEIYSFLEKSVKKALKAGIKNDKIIIDPGIGFGKTVDNNYLIVKRLERFKELGYKILIGLSRKSLIGNLYSDDIDRLPGTIALNSIAVMNGADIIRVHDVKEHFLIIKSLEKLAAI